jgi:CPA2 family monovalent cation:H+ antiporter-2
MVADAPFFRDLALVFSAAVLGALIARGLGQPLVLGYVLGGLAVSPLTPGPAVSDIHTFELFAEIGVILLMFSIGIEFALRDLLRVKWVALLGGPGGILLSILLGWGVGALLGWPAIQGVIVGMVVSVASTMVLARLLMDRGELHTQHGRIMIGITLVEDLAVVMLIVLIPRLGSLDPERLLALGGGLALSLAILVPVAALATWGVPRLLARVARLHSQEVFLLVALAIALGTAAVTQAAGLSLALGAFLAGLVISESDYAHETLARLLPVRDVFVALFFVTIGALIDPRAVIANPGLLAVIVALVIAGKAAIWALVVWAFRYPLATALRVAIGLTQIGEFSFILIQVARGAGHVGDDVYHATLAASLLTILANAFLVRVAPAWIGRAARVEVAAEDPPAPARPVVLCGFGRVGSAIAEALETFGVPYVAIEVDPDIVAGLRRRGIPGIFGDAATSHVLAVAGVARAPLVVVALPDIERAHLAVHAVRGLNPDVPVIARAHAAAARDQLLEAGATEVIQPELEAASTMIRHALRRLALPRERVLAYLDRFRAAMDAAPAGGPPADAALPELREVTLTGAGLAGQSLGEARVRERFGISVVGIVRAGGEAVLHPTADTIMRAGDRLRVFGLPAQVAAFRQAAGADR